MLAVLLQIVGEERRARRQLARQIGPMRLMDTSSDDDRALAIGQLEQIVRGMERSDRVAKLAGLVSRVKGALADGSDLKIPLVTLAAVTRWASTPHALTPLPVLRNWEHL